MFGQKFNDLFKSCYGFPFEDAERCDGGKVSIYPKRQELNKNDSVPTYGRGYPNLANRGVDAEEKDKENLNILAKW